MEAMTIDGSWVFAYGSNMELGDLNRWLTEARLPAGELYRSEPATLPGFRLVWNYYAASRAGGAANVERHAVSVLHGVALHVDGILLAGIDRKEDHPEVYERTLAPARLATGEDVDAWVYVVKPEHIQPDYVPPTRHYRGLLIQGARHHRLPAFYIEELERLRTID